MVCSDHQLLSEVELCNGLPAKCHWVLPIGAPIFPAMVSCNNLLSLCQGFSVVSLDTVVVESEFKVLKIF